MENGAQERLHRILLIEDSPYDVDIFQEMLSSCRNPCFKTTCVSSLKEAVSRWNREGHWDAALLDLNLPDADASTSLTEMRKHVPGGVPIVVLTGSQAPELAHKALENGAHDYLVKDSVNELLLVHTLHYAIQRARLEHERDLLKEKRQETERIETLGRLSAGIAHDFNNLNTVIRGYVEIMQAETPSTSSWYTYLQEILKAIHKEKSLIDRISAFAGTTAEPFQQIDLNVLVREMAHELQSLAGEKRTISSQLSDQAPLLVQAQHQQMSLAVRSLVNNAVEATDETTGVIELKTGAVSSRPADITHQWSSTVPHNKPFAYIEVADNGTGIDENEKPRLFDPFYSTKFMGRGLGLAAVAGIVRDHEGAISVNGTPGKGACFRVLIPCLSSDDTKKYSAPET